jgi:L-threonylcarbamoyladenylate synthase
METIHLAKNNISEVAAKAVEVLTSGGVVLYPTDTLYGLGADAFSDEAVAKIYDIKGRDEKKPIHAIVADIEMAEQYGEIDDLARQFLKELPGGQITLIVKKKKGIDSGICARIQTFGFRIPDNAFCQALLKAFGKPITATSANAAGQIPEKDIDAILFQIGKSARK